MEIYPRNYRLATDSVGNQLVAEFLEKQVELGIENGLVFCEFPLFREDEELLRSKLLIISPVHGLVVLGTFQGGDIDQDGLDETVARTEAIFSHIYAKLLRSGKLRSGRTSLSFRAEAAVFAPELASDRGESASGTKIFRSTTSLFDFLGNLKVSEPINDELIAEIVSIVEGSKGLLRPRERITSNIAADAKVVLVKKLDEEIRRFDRDQRFGYMTDVYGPERITGLAGSGKTVVLAMKAALAHLNNPDAKIAFTFYTKSLYQHVKQLITRFYRQFDDKDPNWDNLKVLHAWGGQINEGLYYYAAKVSGETPLTFAQAKSLNPRQPFDVACGRLLTSSRLSHLFDYVFVDEAQDFPPSFLRLALKIANEEKLVIAYDVFQTIFDVDIPTAEVLFGTTESGEPAVTFEQDIVLHKCYRNPLEVLVCAHAIGFGLYSDKAVQMLESEEHWRDFGYEVTSGELKSGSQVVITRPATSSPCSISSATSKDKIIEVLSFSKFGDELDFVVSKIKQDIEIDGLSPEDILVICADDYNSRNYFRNLSEKLTQAGVATNNLQDDSYSLRNFAEKGQVTLSTIYKAKGNEAFVVFVVGIDGLFAYPDAKRRNAAFVAMTRAKGWLRVSGLGQSAQKFKVEAQAAISNIPSLVFTYPSTEELINIKRDLSQDSTERAESALDDLEDELSPEEYEEMLRRKLRDLQRKKKSSSKRISKR
jgi:superfamily I DNA and RNA helicase